MINEENFIWNSNGGLEMYGYSWKVKSPMAKICLVHGLGEHIERYHHLAKYFNKKNISVFGFDHRGHGKSGGKRGHCSNYDHLIDDIKQFQQLIEEKQPTQFNFIYGHSMGGNLVLNYTLLHPEKITATVSTGPWIELAFKPPSFLVLLAKLIKNIYPAFSQDSNLDTKALTKDPKIAEKYESDPLVHSKITAGLAMALMEAGEHLLNTEEYFKKPVLLIHGASDQLTSHKASSSLASKHPELSFKTWPDGFHEIHNDYEQEKLFEFIYNWMSSIINQL